MEVQKISENISILLTRIDELQNFVNQQRPLKKDLVIQLQQKFILDWNYHSSAIENNSLTYGETRMLLMQGTTAQGKPLKDHLDIEGHDDAIKFITESVDKNIKINHKFVRELHEILLKKTYDNNPYILALTPDGEKVKRKMLLGDYKKEPNNVKTSTGKIKYYSDPSLVHAELTDLFDWFGKEEKKNELHPIILAALFHIRFINIHPFDDGNGRIVRLLMNLILLRNKYNIAIIPVEEKINKYFAFLEQSDVGEQEPFIAYIAEKELATLEKYKDVFAGKPVDEDDDFSKKAFLLKKKLKQNKANIKTRNNDLIIDIMTNFGIDFLSDLEKKITQVKDLFHGFQQVINIQVGGKTIPLRNSTQIKQALNDFSDNDSLPINTIHESWILSEFKYNFKNTFDLQYQCQYKFENTFWLYIFDAIYNIGAISSGATSKVYPYSTFPSEEERKEILNKFGDDLLNEIDKKSK